MKDAQEPPITPALAEESPHAPSLSVEEIRALAQVACEFDLAELDLSRPSGERLRLRRGLSRPADPPAPQVRAAEAAPAPPAPALVAAPVAEDRDERVVTITSPFVGTFYRSAGPEASAFVEEGQRVRKGQTLCIIEAMKLMNELESEIDGVVVRCLADNGRPVEYGEPLFKIRAG